MDSNPTRATHTRAPWIVTQDSTYAAELAIDAIVDGQTVHIALAHGVSTDEETNANAALIAASPMLLEALRGLLKECQRNGSFAEVSFDYPSVKPVFDNAYVALFAAEQK